MKAVALAVSVFLLFVVNVTAQWLPNGSTIEYFNGNVGIGTLTPITNPNGPQGGLEISQQNAMATVWLSGVGWLGAGIRGRNQHTLGTASAKDDIFLAVGGLGFDGTSFAPANKSSIHFVASQDWTPANQGTYITFNTTLDNTTARSEHMRIDNQGRVGINNPAPASQLDVTGDIHATGTINAEGGIHAVYQDVAEWVPVAEQMPAGTVVVVSGITKNMVGPSLRAYDTRVAGVVSPAPGVILGEASSTKAKIATTGRVKVRVDATKHPIAMGDLLVTSNTSGAAMYSEPLDLGGVKIHRPGTLIGKALEPLPSGQGEILVLLSLQ